MNERDPNNTQSGSPSEEKATSSPLAIHFGNETRAKKCGEIVTGYRAHDSMAKCSWTEKTKDALEWVVDNGGKPRSCYDEAMEVLEGLAPQVSSSSSIYV